MTIIPSPEQMSEFCVKSRFLELKKEKIALSPLGNAVLIYLVRYVDNDVLPIMIQAIKNHENLNDQKSARDTLDIQEKDNPK